MLNFSRGVLGESYEKGVWLLAQTDTQTDDGGGVPLLWFGEDFFIDKVNWEGFRNWRLIKQFWE